ncbi:MAG TPA: subclass B1 metallo-beta-lactamase [Cyclobacteriaceae bacterium]|nr:subclass B1 metallo-beta-lactamase [Cyclobacteriaceae bacterium]
MRFLLAIFMALFVFSCQKNKPVDQPEKKSGFELPVPPDWTTESFPVPPSFAPEISFQGVEDIRFAPGWSKPGSEDYWTYAFVWKLEGTPVIDSVVVAGYLKSYYTGLIHANAVGKGIPPDKIQEAEVTLNPSDSPVEFRGTIDMLDYMTQRPIRLHFVIRVATCLMENRTFVYHELSPKPETDAVWPRLDSLWHGFACADTIVYRTEKLIIKKLAKATYQHISFLNSHDFGRVECNGMIVVDNNEAILFDTPVDDGAALELIRFLSDSMKMKLVGVVPTHFHEDCVGGMEAFNQRGIAGYASKRTIALWQKKERRFSKSWIEFADTLTLRVGREIVHISYPGAGHSEDNVVGYFPGDHILFGGCLVKALGASKGNLEDANVNAWSGTVNAVKEKYPDLRVVIPGHGNAGTTALLEYTSRLFDTN